MVTIPSYHCESGPTLPSHAQGSLIKDPPQVLAGLSFRPNPCHYLPATKALCFYPLSPWCCQGERM